MSVGTSLGFFLAFVWSYQEAVELPRGQMGVANVAGDLQDSDDALHVAGEAEAVVGDDQELHDWRDIEKYELKVNIFFISCKFSRR